MRNQEKYVEKNVLYEQVIGIIKYNSKIVRIFNIFISTVIYNNMNKNNCLIDKYVNNFGVFVTIFILV